jgi:hypothetical protein
VHGVRGQALEGGVQGVCDGRGGGNDDIRASDELRQLLRALDDDGALVPVGVSVERGALKTGLIVEERWLVAERVALGRFGEDDVGAVVAEEPSGEGAGQAV